jgi:hypothetical protein
VVDEAAPAELVASVDTVEASVEEAASPEPDATPEAGGVLVVDMEPASVSDVPESPTAMVGPQAMHAAVQLPKRRQRNCAARSIESRSSRTARAVPARKITA